MAQTVSREIKEAAEKAEAKAKEAAAKKDFEKAEDYFKFAAQTYRRISDGVKDEDKKQRVLAHVTKLEQMARQCRAVIKKKDSRRAPVVDVPDEVEEPAHEQPEEPAGEVDIPDEDSGELSLEDESEGEAETAVAEPEEELDDAPTGDVELESEVALEEADESEVAAPPPAKPGVKIPRRKTKGIKRGKPIAKAPVLPGKKKKASTRVGPGAVPPPKVVAAPAPKVVPAPEPKTVDTPITQDEFVGDNMIEHDASDDTLDEIPEGFEPLPGGRLASDGDLAELADTARKESIRNASVVISLDAGDFPVETYGPDDFSIDLSPRFTEALCKALVVGDLTQIAGKFNKLADNLLRKAMAGDPRDELDLRFTALACREVADRMLAEPPGDPSAEIDAARKAYRAGNFEQAAAEYKKAAMKLLGGEAEGDPKLSLHERQASEYLSFSSRLRAVGK